MLVVAGSFMCCSITILFVCVVLLCVLFEPFMVIVCVVVWCGVKIITRLTDVVLVWLLVRLSTGCG